MLLLAFAIGFVFGIGAFFAYLWWAVWKIEFGVCRDAMPFPMQPGRLISSGFLIVLGASMIVFPDVFEWFDEPHDLVAKLDRLWGRPFGATVISFSVWNYLRARDSSPCTMP